MNLLQVFLLAWPAGAIRHEIPKLKVACVGDSITEGFPFDSVRGSSPSLSGYPYHLRQLLDGGSYDVRNFGVSGTTVIDSSQSYLKHDYFQEALSFKPDIVLLMFGANDVKERRLSKFNTDFLANYSQLIASFRDVAPHCKVYLLIPPPMYDNDIYAGGAGGMQQEIYNVQLPKKIRGLAGDMSTADHNITVIDIHGCFLRHPTCDKVNVNCCDWETRNPKSDRPTEQESTTCLEHDDAIHPNDEGYRNMALMVQKVIIYDKEPCD